jgi:hypothetical protein
MNNHMKKSNSMDNNNNDHPSSLSPSPTMIDNPMPHRLPEGDNATPLEVTGTTASDKLVIVMVGLPATGTWQPCMLDGGLVAVRDEILTNKISHVFDLTIVFRSTIHNVYSLLGTLLQCGRTLY